MTAEPASDMSVLLGATLVVYLVGLYALSFWARGRVRTVEDFVVAGRRLGLPLASATLLATWFGAGTLLTATDEVRHGGVVRAALDPFGAGLCLIVAGLFFAAPLWRMGLLTLSDFFRRRFGPRAELASALVMVPSYFGWVAAQIVALAGMLELLFGIDLLVGMPLVALVSMGYTLMGGMWAVTLTDAVQIALVLIGLLLLGATTLAQLGDGQLAAGLARLLGETPPELLRPVPTESAREFLGWLSVLAVGALGNIPGQDLLQRVFAARTARVARSACVVAGVAYIGFGLVPIGLGLAGALLVPDSVGRAVLPALMQMFLSPLPAVVFTVALISAVMSTIDSAILAPATVLSQNVLPSLVGGRVTPLQLNRWSTAFVTAASLGVAYMGESAYALLEDAYELPLVALFVPLAMGLARRRERGELPALAGMITGAGLWLVHYAAGWELFLGPLLGPDAPPVSLGGTAACLAAYLAGDARARGRARAAPGAGPGEGKGE